MIRPAVLGGSAAFFLSLGDRRRPSRNTRQWRTKREKCARILHRRSCQLSPPALDGLPLRPWLDGQLEESIAMGMEWSGRALVVFGPDHTSLSAPQPALSLSSRPTGWAGPRGRPGPRPSKNRSFSPWPSLAPRRARADSAAAGSQSKAATCRCRVPASSPFHRPLLRLSFLPSAARPALPADTSLVRMPVRACTYGRIAFA